MPSLFCGLRNFLAATTVAAGFGLTFLLGVGAGPAAALSTVPLGSGGLTASDLAAALAGPGVTVSNVTFTGAASQAARFSSDTQLGFDNGVVLGSGDAAALGPNSSTASSVNHSGAGDADLAAGNVDAAVLEFDFVPSTANVTMRWVFASDEFPATTPRDAFGIWVNGTRVSLLPSAAVATPALINTAFTFEGASAKHYLRDNDRTTTNCGSTFAACRFDLEADGVSVAFGISATVTAGATNHIKIAVADTVDGTVDSWVYVEAGSLRALESCGNGSDDDGDGRADATDPDCTTMSVTPIGTGGVTAQGLVDTLAGVGIGASSVTFTGNSAQGGRFSNDVVLGLGSGIILSTGNAANAAGPNDGDGITQDFAVNSGGGEYDRAILSFSFVPTTSRVIFRYVFGSEEYDEYASTQYNDRFSLKVNGVNRALLPDGTTAITINNVNGGNTNPADSTSPAAKLAVNPAFFRGNDSCGRPGGCAYNTELDGMTTVLTLEASVTPNVANTLSIEIADVADGRYDSWIALQSDSLVAVEVCANGVDDDGDTLIDSNDPDCNVCGDGLTRGEETCDDGNATNGDCCSASCQLEEAGSTCGNASGTDCNQPDTCDGAGTCLPNLRSPGFACTTDDNACSQDICDSLGSCTHATPESSEVLCRAAAGACDVAETCDGVGTSCPADALAAAGATCRDSAGTCDPAEMCTGTASTCPADARATAGTECRAVAGACDVAETCDGSSNTGCPVDGRATAGTECRASAGICDVAESCTGSSALGCPADALATAGTACRDSAGACDVAETCDGSASACPADALVPNGTQCRGSAGPCDPAETCNGSASGCPEDALATEGTECRAPGGACDVAETCNGSASGCPEDALATEGTECRGAAGACDVVETCNGSGNECPDDARSTAGTECRAAAGACDVAETCDGSGIACPADVLASAETECRGSAGACDVAEICDGSGTACPADAFVMAETECRASAGACDVAETCDGSAGACPVDDKAPSGTSCGDPTVTDCGAADLCDGAGACLSNHFSSGTACTDDSNACTTDLCDGAGSCSHDAGNAGAVCRAAAGECDAAETCDGVATTCPGNGGVTAGTACGDTDTSDCTAPDACDGSGICIANHMGFGTSCTADSDVCSADFCDGAGSCTHPPGNAGTPCRAATDACDAAETCTGLALGCPADKKAEAGTSCGDPGVTECGAADICDGNGGCGSENIPAGTACTADTNPCTADACDGAGSCGHAAGNAGTECRAAAGDCDAAETCDGASASCPADVVAAVETICRATAGDCDEAETCDGTSATCPPDVVVVAGTTCREPAGACDVMESCDGAGPTCPADVSAAAGTECRAAAGACDVSEACDGSAVACPVDDIIADFETCDDGDAATSFEYCEEGICSNGIVPIDLIKLFVWPTAGEGSIVKAKAGFVDRFVFDLSDGVIVRTRDGAGQTASMFFASSECELLSGNRIQCTRENASGIVSDRIRVSPRRGGENRMDLYLNSLDLDFPVAGPVTLDMELKGRRYGSQGVNCSGGEPPATRVTCKP